MLTGKQVQRFVRACQKLSAHSDPWLENLTLSEAVLACIGAGPWKARRRQRVQQHAINMARGLELAVLRECWETWFPLAWQQKTFRCVIRRTRSHGSFNQLIYTLRGVCPVHPFSEYLSVYIGTRNYKCWSLLTRDYLRLPAFPIDRHVRRWLQKHELPLCESEVLLVYNKALTEGHRLPPISDINRAVVGQGFSGNLPLVSWGR